MKNTDEFKKVLTKNKTEVEDAIKDIDESAKPVDLGESMGRLSRMDAMAHQQVALSNKKQLQTKLSQIESALKRIEEDEFDFCVECGDEISQKRLEAQPQAPLCIDCQSDR